MLDTIADKGRFTIIRTVGDTITKTIHRRRSKLEMKELKAAEITRAYDNTKEDINFYEILYGNEPDDLSEYHEANKRTHITSQAPEMLQAYAYSMNAIDKHDIPADYIQFNGLGSGGKDEHIR